MKFIDFGLFLSLVWNICWFQLIQVGWTLFSNLTAWLTHIL